jgi:S1-C subfamily serine protease
VVPRSPADYAGLRNGDVVVGADGVEVKHTKDLLLAISKVQVGGSVRLAINRMGRTGTLDVRPSETPPIQNVDGR